MSDSVFVSSIMHDSTLIKAFRSDLFEANKELAIDVMQRSKAGEPLPRSCFPNKLYAVDPHKKLKKQPHIFDAGGFWVVSKTFADAMLQFQLGHTNFYSVQLYQFDRMTPIEGEYLCLSIGEHKKVFLPEFSPQVEKKPYENKPIWKLPLCPEDGDLTLSTNSLHGVDFWLDPIIWKALFFSGRLAEALRKSKLTTRLGLRQCHIRSNGAT